MAGARHFTELVCWQLADALKVAVYRVSNRPAVKKDFKYRDQIREAAASATSNMSEGFGRRSNAEFARFLDISRASLTELQNHLKDGLDRGYLAPAESNRLIILAKRSCGAVAALQRYLRRDPDAQP